MSVVDVFVFHDEADEFFDDLVLVGVSAVAGVPVSGSRFDSGCAGDAGSVVCSGSLE